VNVCHCYYERLFNSCGFTLIYYEHITAQICPFLTTEYVGVSTPWLVIL